LLFISNYYPPYHKGGYEELCADVAEGLTNRGHSISVITSSIGPHTQDSLRIPIHRILHLEVSGKPILVNFNILINKKKKILHNNSAIDRIINEFNPDAIMVWGMWNLPRAILSELEKFENYPVVYYIADYWPSLPDAYTLHWQSPSRIRHFKLIKKIIAWMVVGEGNRQLNRPNLLFNNVMCVSNSVKEKLTRDVGLPETTTVIYNGIDITNFSFNKATFFVDDLDKPLRMLYAGRITYEKGVVIALQALSELNHLGINVYLDIIGNGSKRYIKELHNLCKDEDISEKVKFHDGVSRDMMPSILSDYDILLVPSLVPDALPRIIQEGMAVGCVVVASDIGGIPEIIEDGVNGLLFSPGDHNDLESKILLMYKNPTYFEQYSSEGRKTVEERFTIKKMVDKIETYLHQIA